MPSRIRADGLTVHPFEYLQALLDLLLDCIFAELPTSLICSLHSLTPINPELRKLRLTVSCVDRSIYLSKLDKSLRDVQNTKRLQSQHKLHRSKKSKLDNMTMTTHPEFNDATEALEVAEVFAENVKGKTALVTGVNIKGIGFSTAEALVSLLSGKKLTMLIQAQGFSITN